MLRLAGGWGYNHQLNTRSRQLRTLLNYLVTRRGVMSHGGATLLGMYASDPSCGPPDTHAFFMPISATRTDPKTGRAMIDATAGAMLLIYPMFPTSRGSIHITGPDPGDKPDIFANFFATEHDRKVITDALARTRTMIGTEPFASIVNYEQTPGPAIDEAATARFATEHARTVRASLDAVGEGVDRLVECARRSPTCPQSQSRAFPQVKRLGLTPFFVAQPVSEQTG